MRAIAAPLLGLTNIPAVVAEQVLLDALAADEWWVDVTLPILEFGRRRVRTLVHLVPKGRRTIVYTDLGDTLGDGTAVPLAVSAAVDISHFTESVRMYLAAHLDHIAIAKLRRNRPLTPEDRAELQRVLAESGVGSGEDLAGAAQRAHALGLFLLGLVGLDREAATEALAGFIAGRTLTADQLDFLELIVGYLTERGAMGAGRFCESPFTELTPAGPESIFSDADVEALVDALDRVQAMAGVA